LFNIPSCYYKQLWLNGEQTTCHLGDLCLIVVEIYTVSKNIAPLACYNFDTCEQIFIFFLAEMLPMK